MDFLGEQIVVIEFRLFNTIEFRVTGFGNDIPFADFKYERVVEVHLNVVLLVAFDVTGVVVVRDDEF